MKALTKLIQSLSTVSKLLQPLVQQVEKQKLDSNFVYASEKLVVSDKKIETLDTLVKDEDKQHWREKRMWAVWMFFSIVTTVVVAALN